MTKQKTTLQNESQNLLASPAVAPRERNPEQTDQQSRAVGMAIKRHFMEPLMIKLKLLNSCSCHTLLAQGSPVQETSGNLSQLEQELQTMAQAEQVAKEVEVAVGNAGVV